MRTTHSPHPGHGQSRSTRSEFSPRTSQSTWRLLAALALGLPAGQAGAAGSAAGTAALRPNILVILTDDVGWGDYQCYNPQGKIPSPNVDRLAREGMRFTHAHTPAALCAPTRYSMLTGNYPWRGRAHGGTWGFNVPSQLLPGQKTVANFLQDAGYRTAMLGKSGIGGQHVTKADGHPDFAQPMTDGPKRWGFDYSFIIPRGHQATPLLFLENEKPAVGAARLRHGEGRGKNKGPAGVVADYAEPGWDPAVIAERLLGATEKFLDDVLARNQATGRHAPFFLHFCSDGAHSPYVPAREIRGVALRGRTKMTEHTDMVFETDVLLGQLIAILERRGLLADTMICLTSDNGGIPKEKDFGHDAVGGLRGSKSLIAEGGHRVPFLVRWPGRVPAGTVRHQVVGAHDIVATALELAGVSLPADQCLDSISLLPVLTGRRDDAQPVRQHLLAQSCPGSDAFPEGGSQGGSRSPAPSSAVPAGMAHALYEGDWKLVINIADQAAAFYNLRTDPTESTNLIGVPGHAERVRAMTRAYREIRASPRSTIPTARVR